MNHPCGYLTKWKEECQGGTPVARAENGSIRTCYMADPTQVQQITEVQHGENKNPYILWLTHIRDRYPIAFDTENLI